MRPSALSFSIYSIIVIANLPDLPSAVLASSGALWRVARPVVRDAEGQRRSWQCRRRWGPRELAPLLQRSYRLLSQLSRLLTPCRERSARECTEEGGSTLGSTIACFCLEEFDRSDRAKNENEAHVYTNRYNATARFALRSYSTVPTQRKRMTQKSPS